MFAPDPGPRSIRAPVLRLLLDSRARHRNQLSLLARNQIMPKVTTIHVSHTGTRRRINPAPEPDPVVKTPFYKHTHADGTVVAPSWTPDHIEATQAGPGQWNRSWEATVAQPNPAGDPAHPRKHNQQTAEPEAPSPTVRFADG